MYGDVCPRSVLEERRAEKYFWLTRTTGHIDIRAHRIPQYIIGEPFSSLPLPTLSASLLYLFLLFLPLLSTYSYSMPLFSIALPALSASLFSSFSYSFRLSSLALPILSGSLLSFSSLSLPSLSASLLSFSSLPLPTLSASLFSFASCCFPLSASKSAFSQNCLPILFLL